MKTRQEILSAYYTEGTDGMPEISADGLLKAMEEYKLQAEEMAFNASRQLNAGQPLFRDFAGYKAYLERQTIEFQQPEPIRLIADSIMPRFLPDDPEAQHLSFDFKTEGITYTAFYTKNESGYWEYNNAK